MQIALFKFASLLPSGPTSTHPLLLAPVIIAMVIIIISCTEAAASPYECLEDMLLQWRDYFAVTVFGCPLSALFPQLAFFSSFLCPLQHYCCSLFLVK